MQNKEKEKGLVWGLLECAGDNNDGVRQTVAGSLMTLGHQQPTLVLSAIHRFISCPQTAPKVQVQSILYNTAENIIRECGEKVSDKNVINTWIEGTMKLLTLPSVSPDLQEAAQGLMVALGCTQLHSTAVMESLVNHIQGGNLITQSIAETLGDLAAGNIKGTVPYLKAILGLVVRVLPSFKQDNLKSTLASMFSKFSEAILEAIANKEPDPDISKESYMPECSSLFESLVNLWLKSSNPTVRNETILALGHLSHLLPKEKLEELAGLVVTTILSLYRKTSSPYCLTFSLAMISDAMLKNNLTESIKFHVDHLLSALFNQVCIVPNYSEPFTVKNHFEVLRCYELLAKYYPESILSHLLQRLENASHMQRVGALVVMKHLVNSKNLPGESISILVSALNPVLTDPNSKVVKSVTQVIIALCHNSHLTSQSGAPFITYLLKHSTGVVTPQSSKPTLAEPDGESVPEVCRRVLHILATNVEAAQPLLWPHLLYFVCSPDHEGSLGVTLWCLAHLANNYAKYDETKPLLVGPPGPPSAPMLLTRLLILSCNTKPGAVGVDALTLLQGLAPHIHPKLTEVWQQDLPQLIKTFQELGNKDGCEPPAMQMWHDSLREFFANTIRTINSEEFTVNIGIAQMEQLHLYDKQTPYLCFLMSLVGVTLKHITSNKTFVATTLDSVFNAANHKATLERESLALCVGTVAATHIDTVLTHIEMWLKNTDQVKRPLSFFNLIKSDPRIEESSFTRASIVLCLGHISTLAPVNIIGSRVDGPIMLHLLNIVNSNKNDLVNEAVINTMSHIARALIRLPEFKLRQRPLLITHLVNTSKFENIPYQVLASVLQALRDLCALEPELNVEERTIILQSGLSSIFPNFSKPEAAKDPDLIKCFAQLSVLLRTVIQKDTTPAALDDVTTLLQSWTVSPDNIIRTKALELLHTALKTYFDHLNFSVEAPSKFNQTCQLLAFITPRLTDPVSEVRSHAVGSVYMVLRIAGRYNGQAADYMDGDLEYLKATEQEIIVGDPHKIKSLIHGVGKVISGKLSFVQLRSFLSCAVAGLQDRLSESSEGVALIMTTVFTLRGHQLHQHIKELLDSIYGRLEKVTHKATRKQCVESLAKLSSHNLNLVVDTLLQYPLPYEKGICETWRNIGHDPELCSAAVDHLFQMLERAQLFTEQPTTTEATVKIATITPLSAICGLREIMYDLKVPVDEVYEEGWEKIEDGDSSEENHIQEWQASQEFILKKFPEIAALLLISYGSYIEVVAPLHQTASGTSNKSFNFVPNRGATTLVPTKIVLNCLKTLSNVLGCESLSTVLTSKIRDENEENLEIFLHSTSEITAIIVHEAPQYIAQLVTSLDTHHVYDMQRVTVAAVFAQLIAEKCGGNYELLENITDGLLTRLNDTSVHVRRLAVRGLANFSHLHSEKCIFPQWFGASEKLTEIISALVGATDQREGGSTDGNAGEIQVALEALRGLAALLPRLPKDTVLQHTPTLLIRIRLFSEKSLGEIREAGLGVLRGLASSVGSSEEFQEHIHLHLLASLIHLKDPHPPTVVMCKSALQALGPHLGSEKICDIFKTNLVPSGALVYHQFITDLTKYMVSDLKEHLTFFIQAGSSYFKSPEPSLRCAAALLIGNLVYHCDEGEEINVSQISHGLMYLLRDPEASVRKSAAIAIPLLFRYEELL